MSQIYSKSDKEKQKTMMSVLSVLSERQKQICVGVLLGDASLQKNISKSTTKYRLKFLQSVKHKEYVFHLYREFAPYVGKEPFFNEKRASYSFQTCFHEDFSFLAECFLKDGKKTKASFFERNPISPRSLAYWFMDDGGLLSYNKDYIRNGIVLNTQNFPVSQVKLLSNNLNHFHNLKTWVKFNKKRPIIAISGKSYREFENLILPFVIPEMRYKLPRYKRMAQLKNTDLGSIRDSELMT